MEQNGNFTALLRSRGLRATPQRLELLRLLANANEPMGIPELQDLPSKEVMDNATFYRGLETLTASGLVREINLRHGHTDYELVRDDEHHHHIICQKCEKIEDIDCCPDSNLRKQILKESGFSSIQDHAVEFFGLCKTCA